jgi:asparagine synthetase B (glutamine-hydrolysing)
MTAAASLYRVSPIEVVAGQVLGPGDPPARRTRSDAPELRPALEEAIMPGLRRPPCLVSFSGGRDSSAVLAVATQLARRHGLPAPVPISYRFTGVPEAEEDDWQELVVRHLGLADWQRLDFGAELDLVGPVAARILRRHGLVYPTYSQFSLPLLEAASGGSLLTGHGGDNLFGPRRATRLRAVAWGRRAPWRSAVRVILEAAPVPVRRAMFRRRFRGPLHRGRLSWLRPQAREVVFDLWADWYAREPLRYPPYVRWCAGLREYKAAFATLDVLAGEADAQLLHPLLDRRFVASLATLGWRGPRDRTQAMRLLFSDVLPSAVLERSDKAMFGPALFSEHSRSFVDQWTGDGVDPELVDADALRSTWAEPEPASGSHMLLQNAWLTTQSSPPHDNAAAPSRP